MSDTSAPSPQPLDDVSPPLLYDAFASYATTPDGDLVREIEAFIESLRENLLVDEKFRKPLELCVDGSDFRRPRQKSEDELFTLITAYLARSRALVLFTGPRSARHPWIDRELAWWLEHRPSDPIYLVVSHGDDPKNEVPETFPPAVIRCGLNRQLWYDFRGARRWSRRRAVTVRPYEEERLRLAAALMGPDVSAADLIAGWRRAAAKARRWQRLIRGAVSGALIVLATFGSWTAYRAQERARDAQAARWAQIGEQAAAAGASRTFDGMVYAASAIATAPDANAAATLIETAQLLPPHLGTFPHDTNDRAVDVVRFVANDSLLASAGYTGILQFTNLQSRRIVSRLQLSGRAGAIDVDHDRGLIAIGTQTGVDLVRFAGEPDHPAPQLVGRARLGERVRAIWFEPDGSTLLFGTFEGAIGRLRIDHANLERWVPSASVRVPDEEGDPLGIIGLSPDWKQARLAIADIQGRLVCVDLAALTRVVARNRHTSEIFGTDTDTHHGVAVGSDADGGLIVFKPSSCEIINRVIPAPTAKTVARDADGQWHSSPLTQSARTGVRVSSDGALVGVAGFEGSVKVYTMGQLALVRIVPERESTRSLDFDRTTDRLVSGSDAGKLRVWQVGANFERHVRAPVNAFAIASRGRWLGVATSRNSIQILDLQTMSPRTELIIDDSSTGPRIESLFATPDGSRVVARLDGRTTVPIWDLSRRDGADRGESLVLRHRNEPGQVHIVSDIAISDDGATLLTGESHQGHAARGWDLATGSERFAVSFDAPVSHVATGGVVAAAADRGGLVRVFSVSNGRVLGSHRLAGPARTLTVAHSGNFVFFTVTHQVGATGWLCAVGGRFPQPSFGARLVQSLRRWRSSANITAVVVSTATASGLDCRAVSLANAAQDATFSPDGRVLAIATSDAALAFPGSITVLSADLGWSGWTQRAPSATRALAFSDQGEFLAVGLQERGIAIWRTAAARLEVNIPLANPVVALAFMPGAGTPIVSLDGLERGVLRILDWRPDNLRRSACQRWPEDYQALPIPTMATPLGRRDICTNE